MFPAATGTSHSRLRRGGSTTQNRRAKHTILDCMQIKFVTSLVRLSVHRRRRPEISAYGKEASEVATQEDQDFIDNDDDNEVVHKHVS